MPPSGGARAGVLPRQVKLFGWVSLLNDFASEMIYPLLPAFVTGVLGAGPQALGALDGAAEFAAALVKLGAGRLADRVPLRGPLIVLGYFIAVVVRPVIAVTGAAWQVIGLRVVDRLGKGLRTPPRDALIADVTPVALRGRAFGLQRGMDHAGAVLGPILAWWLLASGSANVRVVIGVSIVPGMVVLVLAVWAVKGGEGRWMAGEAKDFTAFHRSPPPALFAISLFYLLRMPDTLIILRSQELGVPVAVVPLLWAAVHVVRSSSSFLGGAATDRLGPARVMWAGWLVYALLAFGMARAGTAAAAWGLFLALGATRGDAPGEWIRAVSRDHRVRGAHWRRRAGSDVPEIRRKTGVPGERGRGAGARGGLVAGDVLETWCVARGGRVNSRLSVPICTQAGGG